MSVFVNAGKNIEDLTPARTSILGSIRREKWKPKFSGEIDQVIIEPIFTAQKMTLKFDINIIVPKEIDKKLEAICAAASSMSA